VDKHHTRLIEKSNQLYNELLEKNIIPELEHEQELSTENLLEIVEHLEQVVESYTAQIAASEDTVERKQLRSKRKLPKQMVKQVYEWIERKKKYKHHQQQFGNRNSYSKTDPDATFMRMKDDYMKNGQLKPGYNVQIATEGQYTLVYGIYPNPTDTKTLIPFLDEIETQYFDLPTYIVADAGYGSEQNYEDVITNRKRVPLMKYTMYEREQKKKVKNDTFQPRNWHYDAEEDRYTCPNGQSLTFQRNATRKDKSGFERSFKVYECTNCTGCPFRAECTKAQEGKNRQLKMNERWEQQKTYVSEQLSEEKTGEIYRQRKIDVDPVFGFLKANLGFARLSVRGKRKVEHEIGLALMAVNFKNMYYERR